MRDQIVTPKLLLRADVAPNITGNITSVVGGWNTQVARQGWVPPQFVCPWSGMYQVNLDCFFNNTNADVRGDVNLRKNGAFFLLWSDYVNVIGAQVAGGISVAQYFPAGTVLDCTAWHNDGGAGRIFTLWWSITLLEKLPSN